MMTAEPKVPQCGAVRTQPVGKALLSQQLAHQSDGRAAVSPTLQQHIEDLAFPDQPRATGTAAWRQYGPPFRRGASDHPAEGRIVAAVARSSDRI